jgi:hypothetical protein
MTRYTDLRPDCVPKVEAIVGKNRRILDPQYMDESAVSTAPAHAGIVTTASFPDDFVKNGDA